MSCAVGCTPRGFGVGGVTYGRARSTSGASRAGRTGITLGSSITSFTFSTRLAIGTLWGAERSESGVSASPRWGRIRPLGKRGMRTSLTGGPANPAGPGGPGSPRSPCEGQQDRGVTPRKRQAPMATSGWAPRLGQGNTYGSTTGTSGTSRTRGTGFTLEKGRKSKTGRSGLCQGGGSRYQDTSILVQWPYLVTGSTSGAGRADGTGQTSETVFTRSAISTFGAGVTLVEEDDGRLSTAAPWHPGPSSSMREAGSIPLLPGKS